MAKRYSRSSRRAVRSRGRRSASARRVSSRGTGRYGTVASARRSRSGGSNRKVTIVLQQGGIAPNPVQAQLASLGVRQAPPPRKATF